MSTFSAISEPKSKISWDFRYLISTYLPSKSHGKSPPRNPQKLPTSFPNNGPTTGPNIWAPQAILCVTRRSSPVAASLS